MSRSGALTAVVAITYSAYADGDVMPEFQMNEHAAHDGLTRSARRSCCVATALLSAAHHVEAPVACDDCGRSAACAPLAKGAIGCIYICFPHLLNSTFCEKI